MDKDEDSNTERKTWHVYSFGRRNVLRLYTLEWVRTGFLSERMGKVIPCRSLQAHLLGLRQASRICSYTLKLTPKKISGLALHLVFLIVFHRLIVVWLSFCGLIKGITPKIRMLCFVLTNSVFWIFYVFVTSWILTSRRQHSHLRTSDTFTVLLH